ncbi:MAG: hypothetical protein JWN13_4890 [Betaproteobacteria bacterium]|nr:hypothetical protein [Betaproteobacteria bacterium]
MAVCIQLMVSIHTMHWTDWYARASLSKSASGGNDDSEIGCLCRGGWCCLLLAPFGNRLECELRPGVTGSSQGVFS